MSKFGNHWVQTHKFQIITYCTSGSFVANAQTELHKLGNLSISGYYSLDPGRLTYTIPAGMNSQFCLCVTPADVNGSTIGQELLRRIGSLGKDYSDGWYLTDEPKETDFHALAVVTDLLKTATPNALIYNNISYSDISPEFLNTYLDTVKPDMLMTDTYPYFKSSTPERYPENPEWFNIAMTTRKFSLVHGIPYFTWLEAMQGVDGTPAQAAMVPYHFRLPSESEMRTEVFTVLAMGFKGLSWFGYDNSDDNCREWLVDPITRKPNKTYYWVQSINAEVKNLGVYLRFLNSIDVRFVPNKGNPTPKGLSNWTRRAGGDKYISSIIPASPAHTNRDILIGFFKDQKGRRYFMLQNLYRSTDMSASSGYSTILVNFKNARLPVKNTIYRLDRITGKCVTVHLTKELNLKDTLPGGTADLYSYTPFDLSILQN